jgi:hypothetical protein
MSQLTLAPVDSQEQQTDYERRAAVRYPSAWQSSCCSIGESTNTEWPARIKDISTTGIGLYTNRPFEPGTRLGIELQSPDEELAYTLMTHVMHASLREGDGWLIGCAFARELSEHELQRLL